MTLEMLIAFGFSITHVPDTDTSFTKMVKARTEIAAKAVNDVVELGYWKGGVLEKPEVIFTHDAQNNLLTPEQAVDATKKLAMSIAFHESGYDQKAQSDGGDCSLMQVKPMWISKFVGIENPKKACAAAKADPKLAVFVGLKTLAYKKAECISKLTPEQKKNVRATYWLGAYATGTCGGAPIKSRELCAPAGVCDYH